MIRKIILFFCLNLLWLAACGVNTADQPSETDERTAVPSPEEQTNAAFAPETVVIPIPLDGHLADRNAELSGLAWYGDTLILLPQYPNFNRHDSAVYALPKADIEAFLLGENEGPLTPTAVPFHAPDIENGIRGFEGYEAIAFNDDTVYLTIEASGGGMRGYLVQGAMAPDLSGLTMDTTKVIIIEAQTNLGNMADEAVLIAGDNIVTIYEANGAEVNEAPVTHLFDANLEGAGTAAFPHIPFRITDVTGVDGDGRFWAINYNFPETRSLQTDNDPLAAQYGEGLTHTQNEGVERLVEFQYSEDGITLVDQPPIQLQLLDEDLRNWEGIVRLDNQGFLLATDKFPTTILGFVSLENE
ncbi:MAG: hypothetical protein GY796_27115 [Chloroflexi bacterium]|nr:hypothetical protein [Chloroflexota bacterium]